MSARTFADALRVEVATLRPSTPRAKTRLPGRMR
jgi:hypothetical protein